MRTASSCLARLFGVAALAAASTARADGTETDRQIAQALFDEGRALLDQGRYTEACPKFAESQRLDPAGGTLLNLAVCHEAEGKTATAWSEFRDGLAQAIRDGRSDRVDLANEHIAALSAKLVRLIVRVPEGVAARGAEVMLDQSRLPRTAWGTPIPVDPGPHRVRVEAPTLETWEATVAATETGRTYEISVPALDGPIACPAGTIRSAGACVPESKKRSVAFYTLLAAGGASIAVSIVTGLMALDANAYVSDHCSTERDFCRVSDAADEASRARTMAWVSTVTLAAGASAGVIAFLLPLEKTSSPSRDAHPRVGFGVGAGWTGVSGTF